MIRRRLASRRSGFTLIELLVVICIIAILFGLIAVILVLISERSRIAAAKSLIHNLSLGCNTYKTQLRQYPPMAPYAAGSPDSSKALWTALAEQIQRPTAWAVDPITGAVTQGQTQPYGPIVIVDRKFLLPGEDGQNPRQIADGWGNGIRYAWNQATKKGDSPGTFPDVVDAPALWSASKDGLDGTQDDIGIWEFGRVN